MHQKLQYLKIDDSLLIPLDETEIFNKYELKKISSYAPNSPTKQELLWDTLQSPYKYYKGSNRQTIEYFVNNKIIGICYGNEWDKLQGQCILSYGNIHKKPQYDSIIIKLNFAANHKTPIYLMDNEMYVVFEIKNPIGTNITDDEMDSLIMSFLDTINFTQNIPMPILQLVES